MGKPGRSRRSRAPAAAAAMPLPCAIASRQLLSHAIPPRHLLARSRPRGSPPSRHLPRAQGRRQTRLLLPPNRAASAFSAAAGSSSPSRSPRLSPTPFNVRRTLIPPPQLVRCRRRDRVRRRPSLNPGAAAVPLLLTSLALLFLSVPGHSAPCSSAPWNPGVLVLLGPDGKTLNSNIADIIEDHGFEAWEGFPFSAEKLEILAEKAKAKAASQTLESLLISGDLHFVIGKDGAKVPVSELVGKTILLYFSAKWCGPCRAFLPTLVKEYNKIKEKNNDFEIVFISSDRDQSSFDDFFSQMPWLALPLEDERKAFLKKTFKIHGIPSLVAMGPTGQTVSKDAKSQLMIHGADAFPFTEERLEELQKKLDEMAKGWP